MKSKNAALIASIMLLISVSSFAENADKSGDPIGNSYIINNLQMETDSNPFSESAESSVGEVIFDNSFDDSLLHKDKKVTGNTAQTDILKNMKKKDSRWHLVEYRVRKNDSISKISKKFRVEQSVITSINRISKNGILRENDTLLIPSKNGVAYRIKKGDTLSSIADRYDTDVEKISEHNDIDGKKIIAGSSIFIPDAAERKTAVAAKPAKKTEREKVIIAKKSDSEPADKKGRLLLAWPLRGPITSGFGYRTHPFSGQKKFHCGLDIGAEIGTSVRSAGDGTVIFSGWKGPYGNLVVVQHRNNYITVYAHNSKLLVETDETVKKGQKLAVSGMTGAVTGAHLHFEIRKGIVPLNPSRILK